MPILIPGTSEFQVNQDAGDGSAITLAQFDPDVAVLTSGGFAVSYASRSAPAGTTFHRSRPCLERAEQGSPRESS